MKDMQNEVERLAAIFYERSGKTGGRDLDNWLKAERFLSVWYGHKVKGKEAPAVDRRRGASISPRQHSQDRVSAQLQGCAK